MPKRRELLIILILAGLVTGFTFLVERSNCPGPRCEDALYYRGWPQTYFETGGFAGITHWLLLNFLLDFFFWFIVLVGGLWAWKFVLKKSRIKR